MNMQKVINGKRYNTETAEEVCSWSDGQGKGDFNWHETSLYRTAKGAWFVAGEGGPMSQWRRSTGQNSWGGGDGLNPIDHDEARMLLEEHGTAEQCAEYFAVEEA
jgi:hypothetical protein